MSQRGGPSSGSPDSLVTLLGEGDSGGLLGKGGNPSWVQTPNEIRNALPPPTGPHVRRGGRFITWARCRPTGLSLATLAGGQPSP